MDDHYDEPQAKRFKHQSYNQTLKEVHLPSAFNQTQFDHEVGDNDSHFHEALNHWRQLNLAPGFIRFANKADGLSASMPLLLHNWREIIELWTTELESSDDEGLRALLDLLQKMAHDLRTTLSPVYPDLLHRLLALLPRSISAPALTALLETFSSLFRYLLIPSINLDLLEKTWNLLWSTLPKCLPEIQRAVAEVWASALRKMKAGAREKAIMLLATNAEGVEDASTWVFVYACKSVSQTLHTCTPSIISPLLTHYLSTEDPETTYTLIRRTLTALVHHVKNADQFSLLGDVLIQRFKATTTADPKNDEHLRRVLEVVAVPCAVRQGSRLTDSQKTLLFTELDSLRIKPSLHAALLRFTTALFTCSDMSLWLGPGLKFMQRSWGLNRHDGDEDPVSFALKFNGSLAELEWGGWKLVALPLLLKSTIKPDLIAKEPRRLIGFLAGLKTAKKLITGETDAVWRTRIEKCALDRLRAWKKEDDDSESELNDILTLSTFFSSAISSILVDIINRTLAATEERQPSNASSAWLLGICMQTLAKRNPSEWVNSVDLTAWMRTSIKKWAWSHEVLGAFVSLSQASPSPKNPVPFEEAYPTLAESLLSHARPVRLGVLRLLDSKLVNTSDGPQEVIKRCLQGEEVSLDLQGVRERVLRIGRVGQVVGDQSGADLCTRWLISQLKVNLRPLWSPAATALGSLSQRFGDVVWRLLFAELQGITREQHAPSSWPEKGQEESEESNSDDPWEEERSWRDPSAHKLRSIVIQWSDSEFAKKQLCKAQRQRERFDIQTYEYQLLATLGECSSLVEKHNRDLVPYFLSLTGPDAAAKLPKQKLTAWLTLFSKFSNPKALYSTETLRSLYVSLLSFPDRSLQTVSLSCLFTYKSPHLAAHEDRLRVLLDDTRWRDELTMLDISNLEPQDRAEVVDVLIRLLFGFMLEKRGRARGADRRAAVLGSLAGCTDEELGLLVDLMLSPLGADRAPRPEGFATTSLKQDVSDKQLTGFLTLLGDVLKHLGSRLTRYWPALLGTTIDVISNAQSRVEGLHQETEDNGEQDDMNEDEVEPEADSPTSSPKIIRSIRQLGLKRFADFFRCPVSFDFSPYMTFAFSSFITPRLPSLDKENTQAPSALLELFHVWTLEAAHTRYLVDYHPDTLPKVYDCLVATNVKPSVISRIFDMVEHLLGHSAEDEVIREVVLKPYVSLLLSNIATLVERTKGVATIATPLVQRQISILSEIAQYSTDSNQASTLFGLFAPLLRKSSKFVPEKIKVNLVKIIGNLMPLISDLTDKNTVTYRKTYELLSQLFQSLRSRPARLSLVSTFNQFAVIDTSLHDLAILLESMNAYSARRMDEPDFDRRLTAFATLNETIYKTLPCSAWLPILYNVLAFIQDPVELAVRNSASYSMRHFIDLVASQDSSEFNETFLRTLFPGLKNGLRSKNELVRAEVLSVIAYAVEKCIHLTSLQEMRVLLENGDEEANFFNNILHVQVHRRSRALRRLADHCDEGVLRSNTLAEIFVPLVSNYIVSTSSIDHHLVNDAILTTGRMAKHLAWGAYYALVQKYLKLSRAKDESERVYIRTLVALLDNFHFPMEEIVPEVEASDEAVVDEDEDERADNEGEPSKAPALSQQASAAHNTSRIADAVNSRLLPSLISHLEKHDATTDDNTRIPIAIGIVTVAKHLPMNTREAQITRLVTILCQILRSKSQETRDLTRDSINRIAVSLGPSYLPLILREMRAALLRGPQLHVLAYMAHSLLVHVTSGDHAKQFTNLDCIVNDIAYVSAEVIFGESGKDVQAEDFKTKMREVRTSSSKGFDSFATVAKFITPPKISSLLIPVKTIMQETESLKVMQLVEEVLKRVASGLNANNHLVPTELLALCNTLISQNARFLQQVPTRKKPGPKGDAIVQMKRQTASETNHYANNSFRFVAFGLDLLNTALRRNRFDFRDAAVTSRLEAMVVVVGNTLYSTSASVLLLSLRCAAGLVKCPLKSLEKSLPVLVRQILDIIKQAGNTESELIQVAFKSLATILRDGPAVEVKEKDLVFLIELLSPDLEEPSRQASVFTMLRAIVARKFVVPEIYDLMEKVSEIMVTSQSPQVQELCRGVLLQFLLDYPQGKGRLRKQMAFLAKNLSYIHESGRKSIMELLNAIVAKFQVALVREYADLLFVALVMVVANDDSSKCREMAAHLIRSLFSRLDEEHRNIILSHLHSWAAQQAQPQLTWVSSQVYGFIVDELQAESLPYISSILEDLRAALQRSSLSIETSEEEDEASSMDIDLEWQVPYHALTVLFKIIRVFPNLAAQDGKIAWNLVSSHLTYPHAWVRTAACRLLGLLFTAVPVAIPQVELDAGHPLSREGMQDTAKKLCQQLKSENLDEALGLQVVKNLFYIGKCFYLIPVVNSSAIEDDAEEMLDNEADDGTKVDEEKSKDLNPLPWLFSKLSYQVKSAHIARRSRAKCSPTWSQQPLGALRWFAAMSSHMEATRLEQFLVHILTPVYRITEDDTIRDPQMTELKTIATELQDLVQSKVGVTKFTNVYNQIRQSVLGLRRERKVARVMQVTTNPEAAAKRKMQRNVIKKDSRKRKDRGFLEGKGKAKRRREA